MDTYRVEVLWFDWWRRGEIDQEAKFCSQLQSRVEAETDDKLQCF